MKMGWGGVGDCSEDTLLEVWLQSVGSQYQHMGLIEIDDWYVDGNFDGMVNKLVLEVRKQM